MNETKKPDGNKRDGKLPPPVFSGDPQEELEERLREHPHDKDAQVDVGSDESMDASDPLSSSRGSGDEPAPSSGYPEEDEEK